MFLISNLLSAISVAQEINPQTNLKESESPNELVGRTQAEETRFYPIPLDPAKDKESTNIFLKSVTNHIIQNRGIQDFYQIPKSESEWLSKIISNDMQWHQKLERLEKQFRSAFSAFVHQKSGSNSNSILVQQFSKVIAKLQLEIDTIRRQIVQINVDQQVYISNLRNLPLNSLVVVKMPFTTEIITNGSGDSENINKTIFRYIEEPVLAHVTHLYSDKLNIPFQNGSIRVTFLYPENITRFDDEANEYVYLFQRVEAYPFAQGVTSIENKGNKNHQIAIFNNNQEIQEFLQAESVGDQRLLDWLKKELANQKVNNDYTLKRINTKISYFSMFRNGLKADIERIMESIAALEIKREALNGEDQNEMILKALIQSQTAYEGHILKRIILSYEKYTLDQDVMFSSVKKTTRKKKNPEEISNHLILDSRIAENIPISGRPVKDIFADMLFSASQNRTMNLASYRERIYRGNVEQTHLVQGELEWGVEREEYRILKLSRGSVGSRSQFVIHLAKRVHLESKPSFPSPKTGICEYEIYFNRGNYNINKAGRLELGKASRCLRKYPSQQILITGHTDPLKPQYGEGSKLNNVQLGIRRAEAVLNGFTKNGFDSGRFTLTSVGAKNPLTIGKNEKSLRKNRRVHILSKPDL